LIAARNKIHTHVYTNKFSSKTHDYNVRVIMLNKCFIYVYVLYIITLSYYVLIN